MASFPPDIAFVEERLYPVRCPTFIFLQSDVLLNPTLVFEDDWKPTRTSRILMLQDTGNIVFEDGKYSASVIAVADPSNPWNDDENAFVWKSGIRLTDRKPTGLWNKNEIARLLAEKLAGNGIKSLVVVFSNKHHVFSLADKMPNLSDDSVNQSQDEFDWLEIAKYELGADSSLSEFISEKGIALHSSALISAERMASEIAFKRNRAKVMISTTTLSQGLNLKTQSVILAGTKFFNRDSNEEVQNELDTRALQQVLNASGRAARANVACRGFSIVIPSENYELTGEFSKHEVLTHLSFMGWKENSFEVESSINELLIHVQRGVSNDVLPLLQERALISLLPFENDLMGDYLKNSFSSMSIDEDQQDAIINRLVGIKEFQSENNIPSWVFQSSSLTNIDFELVNDLWLYIQEKSSIEIFAVADTYLGWTNFLIDALRNMGPDRTWGFLRTHIKTWRWFRGNERDPHLIKDVDEGRVTLQELTETEIFDSVWQNLYEVITVWLMGGSLLELGNTLVRDKCPERNQLKRSTYEFPIPRAIEWSQITIDTLSRLAGALSALRDEWAKTNPEEVPTWLQNTTILHSLPMALRFGVTNPAALVWYRSTIQERRTANFLSEIVPTTVENPLDDNQTRVYVRDSQRYLEDNPQLEQEYPLLTIIRRVINYT